MLPVKADGLGILLNRSFKRCWDAKTFERGEMQTIVKVSLVSEDVSHVRKQSRGKTPQKWASSVLLRVEMIYKSAFCPTP